MSQESVLAAHRSNTLTSALSNSPDDSVVDPLIAWLKVTRASRHQPHSKRAASLSSLIDFPFQQPTTAIPAAVVDEDHSQLLDALVLILCDMDDSHVRQL